ncbi:hypothetical protein NM688_g5799 [Phlebia brevispora]|uniref:Uncharacterized protein n=1 Tax=Phlebia brevispora TaxID=194682 RepID=A0ACC1SPE3_9APHY|nr:hypothetical protein NM688_g5799 [Phlebia brevispora]
MLPTIRFSGPSLGLAIATVFASGALAEDWKAAVGRDGKILPVFAIGTPLKNAPHTAAESASQSPEVRLALDSPLVWPS